MDKPYYPHQPISTIESLARCLGVTTITLNSISTAIDSSYTEFVISSKNKERTVYEPKFELKRIQKRINNRIFEKVEFPRYLHGGIKSLEHKRDYVENAKMHSNTSVETIIGLDVKNFYDNIKKERVYLIYSQFFNFPHEVSELLTKLTTYKNKVPQGACTSSYLANLIFFNSEYSLVSKLRGKKITYTRLLDDVSISATQKISDEEITKVIRDVSALFTKHGLKLNSSKTRVHHDKYAADSFEVTGLWVGNIAPKTRRQERRYIRTLVHACEKAYLVDKYSSDYHVLWNKTSGLVAKLYRLEQSNHKALRERLSNILPLFDDVAKMKIIIDCKSMLKIAPCSLNYGKLKRLNLIYSKLGILSRNYKQEARLWRKKLKAHFVKHPKKSEVW